MTRLPALALGLSVLTALSTLSGLTALHSFAQPAPTPPAKPAAAAALIQPAAGVMPVPDPSNLYSETAAG